MAVVEGGRFARTRYTVVERKGTHTLLRCELDTGRTHQIRVHLAAAGHPPAKIHTTAKVHFGPVPNGFAISKIELTTEGSVPSIDATAFERTAAEAKQNCPVSKALKAVEITLAARLV